MILKDCSCDTDVPKAGRGSINYTFSRDTFAVTVKDMEDSPDIEVCQYKPVASRKTWTRYPTNSP